MSPGHREFVATLLSDAAAAHAELLARLPAEIAQSLPVDAQGVTQAIDHLAAAAGLSEQERIAILRPHAVNPAVLHARVFGATPLSRETVIGSFVDGARVRAEALGALAEAAGGPGLVAEVQRLLLAEPPPSAEDGASALAALGRTYAVQERAAMMIAAALDAQAD